MFQHFGAFLGRDKLSDKLAEHQETIWAIDFPKNLIFFIIPKRFILFPRVRDHHAGGSLTLNYFGFVVGRRASFICSQPEIIKRKGPRRGGPLRLFMFVLVDAWDKGATPKTRHQAWPLNFRTRVGLDMFRACLPDSGGEARLE